MGNESNFPGKILENGVYFLNLIFGMFYEGDPKMFELGSEAVLFEVFQINSMKV